MSDSFGSRSGRVGQPRHSSVDPNCWLLFGVIDRVREGAKFWCGALQAIYWATNGFAGGDFYGRTSIWCENLRCEYTAFQKDAFEIYFDYYHPIFEAHFQCQCPWESTCIVDEAPNRAKFWCRHHHRNQIRLAGNAALYLAYLAAFCVMVFNRIRFAVRQIKQS